MTQGKYGPTDQAATRATFLTDSEGNPLPVSVVSGGVTVADGADVAEGTTTDVAWVSGAGTIISLLKKIAAGGGSAVSIADGSDVVEGTLADAAITTDVNGTVSGKLRGIVKLLSGTLTVAFSAAQHVILDASSAVIGHVITDATSVTNATLSAETTKVIGTVNQGTSPWVTNDPGLPDTLGQKTMANSTGVVLASDHTSIPVAATLSAETTKVIGTINVAAGQVIQANAGTNLNTSALNLEATQALIKAKTDNLDVLLSTRLKPADTLAAVTSITNPVTAIQGTRSAISNAWPIKLVGSDDATVPVVEALGGDVTPTSVNALWTKGALYGFNGSSFDRLRATIANGLAVDVTRSALPTGAATDATLVSTNTKLDTVHTDLGLQAKLIDTQPVSVAALPLPLGATLEVTQFITRQEAEATHLALYAQQMNALDPSRGYEVR